MSFLLQSLPPLLDIQLPLHHICMPSQYYSRIVLSATPLNAIPHYLQPAKQKLVWVQRNCNKPRLLLSAKKGHAKLQNSDQYVQTLS